MKTIDLHKTFNVNGVPHIDVEGNVCAWSSVNKGVIEKSGFDIIKGLAILHKEREILEGKIAVLEFFIETAEPMREDDQ